MIPRRGRYLKRTTVPCTRERAARIVELILFDPVAALRLANLLAPKPALSNSLRESWVRRGP